MRPSPGRELKCTGNISPSALRILSPSPARRRRRNRRRSLFRSYSELLMRGRRRRRRRRRRTFIDKIVWLVFMESRRG